MRREGRHSFTFGVINGVAHIIGCLRFLIPKFQAAIELFCVRIALNQWSAQSCASIVLTTISSCISSVNWFLGNDRGGHGKFVLRFNRPANGTWNANVKSIIILKCTIIVPDVIVLIEPKLISNRAQAQSQLRRSSCASSRGKKHHFTLLWALRA